MELILSENERMEYDARPCPFCGACPAIQPWHGGPTSKRRLGCVNVDCHVAPAVTGNTRRIALERWNSRKEPQEAS